LLLLESSRHGYVPYSVQSDIAEAWKLFKHEELQVFFFDDFLGRTALFDTVGTDARDLANFIQAAKRSRTTRLILATREYVLRQARQEVEELRWAKLDADKYELKIDRYSRIDRARIFYNHIYFSDDVDTVALKALLKGGSYFKVIDHDNYSPRLIEWITGLGGYSLRQEDRRRYADFCVAVLDHPEELWNHAFDRGLPDEAQILLLLLPGLAVDIELNDLEAAYRGVAEHLGAPAGPRAFEAALKLVQDSFVRLGRYGDYDVVSALNPSLIDFTKGRLLESSDVLEASIRGSQSFEQAHKLYEIWRDAKKPVRSLILPALAHAARSTLLLDPPDTSSRPFRPRPEDPASVTIRRLQRLCEWIKDEPTLREDLAALLSAAIAEVVEEISTHNVYFSNEHASIAESLRVAGLNYQPVAEKLKEKGSSELPVVSAFKVLVSLWEAIPDLFSVDEWAQVKDEFASFGSDALRDGPGYFDDLDELYDFTYTAERLGVDLDEDLANQAAQEVEDAVAEREAEAGMYDRDDDEREPWEDERVGPSENEQIDGMFGSLMD
jgi:hypothetical protein